MLIEFCKAFLRLLILAQENRLLFLIIILLLLLVIRRLPIIIFLSISGSTFVPLCTCGLPLFVRSSIGTSLEDRYMHFYKVI